MTVHKEGYRTITAAGLAYVVLSLISFSFLSVKQPVLAWIIFVVTTLVLLFLISFFRLPKRKLTIDENCVVAPADGKIVVIEEANDEEYFKDKRLQVSIFMSPANVHVNRNPIGGEVVYNQYHKGKYLVAWHPKSSTENERYTVVIKNPKVELLVKQIAGALAKRIVNYLQTGQKVDQSAELGFIKFGSRVDVLLPIGTKIEVKLSENVKGGVTVLARL
jgi:phosphatidylserine decarboxylase